VAVKRGHEDLVGNAATCWTSGTPVTMWHYRADVLRFLPIRLDKNNKPTGKRLANDADLVAHGQPLHSVTLPTRSGNQLPESAGAALVIIYRDPSQPLRKIVYYDGIHIQSSLSDVMTQTLRGFYKSSGTKSARITNIFGSGQPNNNERVFFDDGPTGQPSYSAALYGTQISPPNPILGASSSERSWSALTYDVSTLMNPGNNSGGGFGETATATVNHSAGGGNDCLTWEGVIFSTALADVDHDGLPDGLEDATSGLKDPATPAFPSGQPLPNLNAMLASSSHEDIFIEVNAMRTFATKVHGSSTYPYNSTATPPVTSVNVPPHTHMPTPAVLKLVGDAYVAHGITPHFDVGDLSAYHSLGVIPHAGFENDDYTSFEAESYLVAADPRGGEVVDETACDASVDTCQFPGFPGVVGWKFGLQLYRDWAVTDLGQELHTQAEFDEWTNGTGASTQHRQRFDSNRRGLFHYLLYAHYRGLPKSEFPCLDTSTTPSTPTATGFANGACSGTNIIANADYHVPSSSSGVADLPGGNAMVTLGRWDDFVGKPFVRASTTFHELGHNLNLSHGGFAPIAGNKALNTATFIEPNCKPNYLSSMSYSFQVLGLFSDDDSIHLDYSTSPENNVGETAPEGDAQLSPAPMYRPAWYAPAGSQLATTLGVTAATRFCSGTKFNPSSPPASMARVYTLLVSDPINWNGDANTSNTANPQQDINFDASLATSLRGFDDWANLSLNQIGAGLKVATFQNAQGGFTNFEGGFTNFEGGFTNFEGGFGNFEGGFTNFEGGFTNFEGGFGNFEGGFTNFEGGFTNFEGGFTNFEGAQELEVEAAKGLGRSAPYSLKACIAGPANCLSAAPGSALYHARNLTWQGSTFGHVLRYHASRKRGNAQSTSPYVAPVPTSTSPTTSLNDTEQLPDGIAFTYRVRAEFDDPAEFSGYSKTTTITVINAAPQANNDPSYTTSKNKSLKDAASVLANDTDDDSPKTLLRAVLVSGPANGALVFNADGSFTYTPKNGFAGVDTFTYKADDGLWNADPSVPLSPFSNVATVTITVTAK
jgi:hypothetical protein